VELQILKDPTLLHWINEIYMCVKANFLNSFKRFRKAENKLLEKTFMHFNFGVTLNTWIILNKGAALMKFILIHIKNNSEMCVQCINFI
jgi:hypothetical protein